MIYDPCALPFSVCYKEDNRIVIMSGLDTKLMSGRHMHAGTYTLSNEAPDQTCNALVYASMHTVEAREETTGSIIEQLSQLVAIIQQRTIEASNCTHK